MALAIGSAASSLAPGFRFHPTDEELVRYYLRRKVCGKPFRFDAISDVDVYKVEPWDLPGLSRLKTRDLEWYFFSVLDKKCGNSSRTNRATEKGYWKTTGKDRAVHHRSQQVGMKKTLVYHSGRAPKGERTNWVMHEYRLIDQELQNAGHVQDAYVLCRIFHKSGSGPKNGEKYGAPFVEEEWEDDESVLVPKQEDRNEELPVDKDSYLNANDIEQILGTDMPQEVGPLPLTFDEGDNVNRADISATMTNDPQKSLLDHVGESEPQADTSDGSTLFDQAVLNGLDLGSVNHEYIGEPDDTMNFDMDYLLDEPYFDAVTGDFSLDDSLFFEANDLKHAVESDPGLDMLDEYLSFGNSDIDNLQYTHDSIGSEKNILPDSSLTLENVNNGTHQVSEASQAFEGPKDDIASSSKKDMAAYPFMKKASYMLLGNIAAPPAFASEFPTKYLDSEALDSSHVTSGMIRISSDVSFGGGAVDLSLGKHAQLNIVLSFGMGQRGVDHPHEGGKASSRSWFYCILLWILVVSLSFKVGSLICPRSLMS